MEVRFKPETEQRLNELASLSGRPAEDLIEDAMADIWRKWRKFAACLIADVTISRVAA